VWLRVKRVLLFLAGCGSIAVGVGATVVRPRPEMPAVGYTIGLWVAALALIVLGGGFVWLSLRGSDRDIRDVWFP
jgi:hypothetical protein